MNEPVTDEKRQQLRSESDDMYQRAYRHVEEREPVDEDYITQLNEFARELQLHGIDDHHQRQLISVGQELAREGLVE